MKFFSRWVLWVALSALGLQLFFLARIATLAVVNPESTTFERSEAWRLLTQKDRLRWSQRWVPYARISDTLKRAVIASEDADFVNHEGVDWEALEKAWEKNAQAEAAAARRSALARAARGAPTPKIVGGSTITQQLAKNLLLSGERTLLRKGQEFVLTLMLEAFLSKQRILEIYLNHVEWGEGIFGAEAAAQHYYRKSAAQLSAWEAARLAVMLPRPKYFEKLPQSAYLSHRAEIILGRMPAVELP
ncbi:monofunctional biosynthetic peptidoglycan transglycosylase [Tibeticola sp.]|jgi:monofunctional biosynthetic peptidoglycan transglycosylase|uniref:monofunctional biosynthetic peptidoglycan transglycosylase n=1 Tax=Tibeticola sp. TaxID=2005368 RepID=UPI00258A9BCA|nr:monofunctional biosynthetic peptidoglycan transglycosylase [Tibeticola sp.]MCI4439682.1 monofunctional biosynthetic peptidoglycan transglycosylase [Tibeticola sp.]